MSYMSKFQRAMGVIVFSIFGGAAHAGGMASVGVPASSELSGKIGYVVSGGGLSIRRTALADKSLQALNLPMQKLIAAQQTQPHRFEGILFGADSSWAHTHSVFLAETPGIHLATLETESSKAIEDMKRLLQGHALPVLTPLSF